MSVNIMVPVPIGFEFDIWNNRHRVMGYTNITDKGGTMLIEAVTGNQSTYPDPTSELEPVKELLGVSIPRITFEQSAYYTANKPNPWEKAVMEFHYMWSGENDPNS